MTDKEIEELTDRKTDRQRDEECVIQSNMVLTNTLLTKIRL